MTFPIQTNVLTSRYGWNEATGRYIDLRTGQFVRFADVRDALESVIDASAIRINVLTKSLVDGQISLAEWQSGMLEQVKLAHTASAASARGGWAQMSQSDWGAAGRLIRTQYDFLRNFSDQIASGEQLLNGTALVRADMYGDAARGTFEEMRRRYERTMNGMEFERRVLGEADHCPDCLDYAAEGWQPIGTLPAIGDSICLTNCHCTFEYRTGTPDIEESEAE
ncbi:MAG TPA: hypothetical protein VI755_11650 [Anaerolineales bacterium]|nr:hypothetical protein [Anaerolineales bacterium]